MVAAPIPLVRSLDSLQLRLTDGVRRSIRAMPGTRQREESMLQRRSVLGVALAAALPARAAVLQAQDLIRAGAVVVAYRHALAPGTFDPPGFRLGDCSTQRNLSDAGRAQAQRIGRWFQTRALVPTQVRSSPWCRCIDTARLAFGQAQVWQALGSPAGTDEVTNHAHVRELREALATATRQPGRFEVWVTHMFVLSALAGSDTALGEALVLGLDAAGGPRVLARLEPGL
jgi:hypothetical protein